ncbi:hypothetical protein KW807_00910 [Candidatus Parcubacteria bacterium]|nr:hypothetical protein [Candidatus Parcubacteria bacterium]
MNNLQFTIYKKIKYPLFIVYCLLFLSTHSVLAQSVDLLWQAQTYTPPFYEGKALWSKQSVIRLVAIPQGLGTPSNLIYKWIRNDTVLGNISGVGKNTLTYVDSILSRPQTFEVQILSSDDSVLARDSVSLAPRDPSIAVYENNPLYGFLFHREVGGEYDLREKEVSFGAFPYFFSVANRVNNQANYEWRVNNGSAQLGASVTYRAPEDNSGSSIVSIKASHVQDIVQEVKKDFLVKFGENNAQ